MPELRIIIDGTTRLCAPYCVNQIPALARSLAEQWPALALGGRRVAVVATGSDGVAHIVARQAEEARRPSAPLSGM